MHVPTTIAEYLVKADEADLQAAEAVDLRIKHHFALIADTWRKIAALVEREGSEAG